MNEEICCITKEKGKTKEKRKTAMNKWDNNDDSDSCAKIYKYFNKFITQALETMVPTF